MPARAKGVHGRKVGLGECPIERRIGGKNAVRFHFAPVPVRSRPSAPARGRTFPRPRPVLANSGKNCHEWLRDGKLADPDDPIP